MYQIKLLNLAHIDIYSIVVYYGISQVQAYSDFLMMYHVVNILV